MDSSNKRTEQTVNESLPTLESQGHARQNQVFHCVARPLKGRSGWTGDTIVLLVGRSVKAGMLSNSNHLRSVSFHDSHSRAEIRSNAKSVVHRAIPAYNPGW